MPLSPNPPPPQEYCKLFDTISPSASIFYCCSFNSRSCFQPLISCSVVFYPLVCFLKFRNLYFSAFLESSFSPHRCRASYLVCGGSHFTAWVVHLLCCFEKMIYLVHGKDVFKKKNWPWETYIQYYHLKWTWTPELEYRSWMSMDVQLVLFYRIQFNLYNVRKWTGSFGQRGLLYTR